MDTLHEQIVAKACKWRGWQRGDWRKAFFAKCKENETWQGEIKADTNEDGTCELFAGFQRNPDAWRLVVEGPDTPNDDPWQHPVLVLEFLEVEVSHPMPLDKRRDYMSLWWVLDGTSTFHCRVYRIERYGDAVIWLDTQTVYSEMETLG